LSKKENKEKEVKKVAENGEEKKVKKTEDKPVKKEEKVTSKENNKEEKTSKKEKKGKSKKKIVLYVTILIVMVVLAGLLYLAWSGKKEPTKEKVEVKELENLGDDWGYTLKDNDSELFKSEFAILKEIINSDSIDTQKYSEQVAKMFIIDVYTLSTKMSIYDVGGIEFFYSDEDANTMFQQKLIDTMYSTLEDNTYGDREQELPEVKSINVESSEKTTFEYIKKVDDKEVKEKLEGFKVLLTWDYVKDMGYDKKAELIVVKDGEKKYSVVKIKTNFKE